MTEHDLIALVAMLWVFTGWGLMTLEVFTCQERGLPLPKAWALLFLVVAWPLTRLLPFLIWREPVRRMVRWFTYRAGNLLAHLGERRSEWEPEPDYYDEPAEADYAEHLDDETEFNDGDR